MHNWHPAVKKTDIIEGENNKKGAVRVLTLGDGGTIKEKLLAHGDKSLKYNIMEGVLPVSDYVSTIKVKPGKSGGSLVEWQGKFKRKAQGDNPPQGQDDKTAMDTITSVYKAGLENLRRSPRKSEVNELMEVTMREKASGVVIHPSSFILHP